MGNVPRSHGDEQRARNLALTRLAMLRPFKRKPSSDEIRVSAFADPFKDETAVAIESATAALSFGHLLALAIVFTGISRRHIDRKRIDCKRVGGFSTCQSSL